VTSEVFFRVIFSILWATFFTVLAWVARSTGWSPAVPTTARARQMRILVFAFAGLYFVGALLYSLFPSWVMFLSIPASSWLRFVMIGVAGAGLSIVFLALRSLGKNWAPSLTGMRKETFLVTTGPYGVVRHPIYLGAFIFLAALALLAANLLIILPTIALLTLLYAQLPEEERMLIERFGDKYRDYMKRTPRFIPRLGRAR
jgi:protein-S-isoprenylcysteine O-methyltransferase Ste14